MKLLMISGDRSVLSGKKGAFYYTLEEFSKHWDRIDVICPNGKSSMANHKFFENVFFHPSPRSLIHQSQWIVEKGKQLLKDCHDTVMTVHEYPPFYNGIGARRLHQSTNIPYTLEVHHIVGLPHAATFAEWIGRVGSRWQIPRSALDAKAVRVVNNEVKQTLARWGVPEEKIHIVPSFYLDTDALRSESSAEKTFDLVFCGRLVANKGLPNIIKAVHALPRVTLLVIGDGPQRSTAERLVRSLSLTDRVTFAGWLPSNTDVYCEMQCGKIFVMNSLSEGGPRVLFEAMALGLPVIATRVGAAADVIKDGVNGIFTNGEPDDLAQKISKLINDESLRTRLGHEARKITETFERKKLIKRYADFLQRSVG